jgi:hypothetical protein
LNQTKETETWFVRRARAEAEKDTLPYSERGGNVVAIGLILLVTLYFVLHQLWATGFFTSQFGSAEMILFYALLLYGLVPAGVRMLIGRKNLARLFDVFQSILFTITLAWLYIVFPFDFTHFANVLPEVLRFLVQWISNDIARVLMILGLIAAPIMAIYTTIFYVLVRRELAKPTPKPE